jgi:septum formation protein
MIRSRPKPARAARRGPAPSFLVLASASPRRASLLRELGIPFTVVTSHAAEISPGFLSPAETAQLNACRKAASVARQHRNCTVLAADTVVSAEGFHFGKPATVAEAAAMLKQLQGKTHQVATGICMMNWAERRCRVFAETTSVKFRKLNPGQIRRYLRTIDPLDKAGGYAIQEEGESIIDSIQGSYSNVVGLPVERLREELGQWSKAIARHL